MPYCSQCGSQNADNAKFCSQCGSPLTQAQETPAEASDTTTTITFGGAGSGRRRRAGLARPGRCRGRRRAPERERPARRAARAGAGSRYLLDTDLSTVGRHPESDIFLDDITVSRRHVEFRRQDGAFRVHDVGSLNGTYVNGDRVDDAELQNGDEVRIGKFRLIFFASDEKAG